MKVCSKHHQVVNVKRKTCSRDLLTLVRRWANLHSLGMTHSMIPSGHNARGRGGGEKYFQHPESVNFSILLDSMTASINSSKHSLASCTLIQNMWW